MVRLAGRLPRMVGLLGLLALLCVVSPETLDCGPDLCVWRNLLGIAACPACGSTRALAALFHGRLTEALTHNLNVVVTAPGLLLLTLLDALRVLRGSPPFSRSSLNSRFRLNRVSESG